MSVDTLPNFLIGGVNNGGTSYLYSVLKQHPEVYLPEEMRPEPSFFFKSWEYKKGLKYYANRWFGSVPGSAKAIGEKSANYLFGGATVARRIRNDLPEMRIIFILRNPIERAWANYRFTVLEGLENLTFEQAVKTENSRMAGESGKWAEIQPRCYVGRGMYARNLKGFLSTFPSSQILIVKSELLSSDTNRELRKIYEFLGLENTGFIPRQPASYTSKSVVDPAVQMELRKVLGDRFDTIVEATRLELDLTKFADNETDMDAVMRLRNNMKDIKEKMPSDIRQYLASVFEADLNDLRTMVDFDISDWK